MKGYLEEEHLEHLSDGELLTASLAQPSLFAFLVRKYEAQFLRRAESIIHSSEEAQDIVQETFTKIYLNASKFKKQEGAQFSSWAWRILINTSLTHYAKRRREQGVRADLEPELFELIPDKNLRQFEKKEFEDLIASVLVRMSPLFARVLSLFFIDGLSQEEIARREGISVGAVKTRVHRAKKEFREVYETIGA
ncbi:MAG: RNA polymerase sigma factor [Patescibacteria group bacterium]|nr:RNA polymerase sigma factor [Patescibacteria group bacterium]